MSRRRSKSDPLRYARALLASAPSGYRGVAAWLFRAAKALHPLYPDKGELTELIRAAASGCGRDVSDLEIREAIENSAQLRCRRRQDCGRPMPWPKPNHGMAQILARRGPSLAELRRKSPVKFDERRTSWAEEILDYLFPGSPLLCAGPSRRRMEARPRQDWRGALARQQLIIPSPVVDVCRGASRGGGRKAEPFIPGPRRFLVIELPPQKWPRLSGRERVEYGNERRYYAAQLDQQAALLVHCAGVFPLAAVTQQADHVLQGWLFCQSEEEDCLFQFMAHAVTLGANRATWDKNWAALLPDGGREVGQFHETIYLDPGVIR